MPSLEIAAGSELDREDLTRFIQAHFPAPKSRFILENADWKYAGLDNTLAVVEGERIAAYCAVMPATILVAGRIVKTRWWVDLVVDPEYRGRGLQTLLDRKIRESAALTVGFPNPFAAILHRKHGWGVREDGAVLMLPLRPDRVLASRKFAGIKGLSAKAAGFLTAPAAAAFRARCKRFEPVFSKSTADFDPAEAAALNAAYRDPSLVTTLRDEGYFKWRYRDAPEADELSFFRAENNGAATHLMVTRTIETAGMTATRILDIVGDPVHAAAVRDLVKTALKAAVKRGTAQVTVMAWPHKLIRLFRSLGFIVGTRARFCWYSQSGELMRNLAESPLHWTLGDADNDEPV
jgi:GNAT superfamily N-acetyltransferase